MLRRSQFKQLIPGPKSGDFSCYNILMFNRDISLRRLERFLFRYSDIPNAAAETTAQIVGVFIGVKPAMEGDFSAAYSDAKILWRFTKVLEELKLCVIFESAQSTTGGKTFYVARSHKKAAELQEAFRELWCKGPSAEIHTRIGTLLGYPESSVQYFIRAHTENGISDNHMERGAHNRFYAHSAAHEDEEFAAYEAPIYKQLVKHCPKATKTLRSNTEKRWLN